MLKENLNYSQNLYDIQSLSRYSLVDKELSYEKYYRVIDFSDIFNEYKFNEVVW